MKKYTYSLSLGVFVALILTHAMPVTAQDSIQIDVQLKKWHKVTLTFKGPETSERAEYNPFLNYRLNVAFSHNETGSRYVVPGYFAADGNAANTSAKSGNKWRVHFAPGQEGEWNYEVSFRKGLYSAVSSDVETGESAGYMDGEEGSFVVGPTDKTGRDFRGKGRLQYVNEPYLRFAETGEYFLKSGADAPENLLAYADFDGTFHDDGHEDQLVKTWEPHVQDWQEGDPTWQGNKGKGLIGALNYLASEGQNAISFLTLSIAGDDENVFPYVDRDTYDRFDVSKLAQWEVIFEHADSLGLFLHFKTQEAENQGLLDGGGMGATRRLYYRELIARFGHHLALNWNLGEENGEWGNPETPPQFTQQRVAMARYFRAHDPYQHHVVIHNGVSFDDLLGPNTPLTGISLQTSRSDFSNIHPAVIEWRSRSEETGSGWAIAVDEPGDHRHSLIPDKDNPSHDNARKNALWGALLGGAWGIEWYFGYEHDHSDLTAEDWRSRDLFWDQARHALAFFDQNNIPFWKMESLDELAEGDTDYVFAQPGEYYVLYLKDGGKAAVNVADNEAAYTASWYNPREGGQLTEGTVESSRESDTRVLSAGEPPSDPGHDWVVLIQKASD